MALDSGSQSGESKTPQQELEELLRNARSGGRVKPTVISAAGSKASILTRWPVESKVSGMAIAVAGLAIVLMFGTGYFIVSNLQVNTGLITFETSEQSVHLQVNDKSQGVISSGSELRLKAGEYRLTFAKEGFLENEQVVKIASGESLSVAVSFLPIPVIDKVVDGGVLYPRLNKDGSEVSYLDPTDRVFKTVRLADKTPVDLFRGSFPTVSDVMWSAASQLAIVQLRGQFSLSNMIDNRGVVGGYVLLGERPKQGAAKNNGIATWLFDDSRKLASSGWQPILLNESIRQVAYAADGSYIVYIYETADGERSLVRALPDGTEWERMITDLPQFSNPKLVWGADDRYLMIEDGDKLFVADLVNKSLMDVFPDRVPRSRFAVSNEGDKVAYRVGDKLRVYDFLDNTTTDAPNLTVDDKSVFVWLDANNLVVAMGNQTFIKVDVGTGQRITIPFVGAEGSLDVIDLSYSRSGQVLMLVTTGGVYAMKI